MFCNRRVTIQLAPVKSVTKMNESRGDDSAAILAGRLVRSYRDDARRNGKRLSLEGLLDLMVDRSSVSGWESGARLAPRAFLVAIVDAQLVQNAAEAVHLPANHVLSVGYCNLSPAWDAPRTALLRFGSQKLRDTRDA